MPPTAYNGVVFSFLIALTGTRTPLTFGQLLASLHLTHNFAHKRTPILKLLSNACLLRVIDRCGVYQALDG